MNYPTSASRPRITLGQSGNALISLIAVCLILFVGLAFMKAVWYFRYPKNTALGFYYRDILSWFVMPAEGGAFWSRPWTLFTHFFVHDNFWRVFSNMLWLWTFGYIMQDLTGNRKIVPIFIYGSLLGAAGFTLGIHLIPNLRPLLPVATLSGASAGVMAVAVATTLVSPGYRLFPFIGGGIPLWVLTGIYVVTSLLTVSISDNAALVHQLAGALGGFGYIFLLRRGWDTGEWMSRFADWVNNLFNPNKPARGRDPREDLFYNAQKPPFTKTPQVTQERIDAILDKISQQGYHFLTQEERDLLKRASRDED